MRKLVSVLVSVSKPWLSVFLDAQSVRSWSQWSGLNRRPTVYETVALPLSYIGITDRTPSVAPAFRRTHRSSVTLSVKSSDGPPAFDNHLKISSPRNFRKQKMR